MANSSLVDDPAIWQPGFDLPRCYWAFLNHFWTDQGHGACCRKKWGLAATDLCPCGKRQMMSDIVNCCPQSKLEGAVLIALSWWRCYRMAEDQACCHALKKVKTKTKAKTLTFKATFFQDQGQGQFFQGQDLHSRLRPWPRPQDMQSAEIKTGNARAKPLLSAKNANKELLLY